jgi:SAM-dependent methyltransferase
MNVTHSTDGEQTALWNSPAACAWVDAQELIDRVYSPLEDLLVEAAIAASADRVVDVGCGTGGTTLAVARRLGANGNCVGIDVSEPMIAAARARAEREHAPARFICADAATHMFEPASVELIISRFGVMFFNDFVAAFANLRRAVIDGGQLRFIAWRSADENPFMTTAERAAAALLPNIPARQPDAPGQFAFADRGRVSRVLEESGWAGIDVQPIDVPCTFSEKELVGYLSRFGPLGRILPELDEKTRARVIEAVRPAFDSFVHGAEVRFTAACWMVSALSRGGRSVATTAHER